MSKKEYSASMLTEDVCEIIRIPPCAVCKNHTDDGKCKHFGERPAEIVFKADFCKYEILDENSPAYNKFMKLREKKL